MPPKSFQRGREQGSAAKSWIADFAVRFRSLLVLFILVFVFANLSDVYLSWHNIVTMTSHVSVTAIMAVGVTFVILTAGIDLSVGSIAGLSGVVAGFLIQRGISLGGAEVFLPAFLVIIVAIAAGASVGAVNGIVITTIGVPPFIVTLGMLFIARGVGLLISDGSNFINLEGRPERHNTGFEYLGTAQWFHLPVQIFVMIAVALVASFVATRSVFGRQVYAVGGNERAARSAGVRVQTTKIAVYTVSGACAGLCGVILASQLVAADPSAATNYELGAIAAVVLGGTSLFGGRGSIIGSVSGAFVIGFLNDGLVITNVSEFWQMIATGLVIVGAVGLDEFQRRAETALGIA